MQRRLLRVGQRQAGDDDDACELEELHLGGPEIVEEVMELQLREQQKPHVSDEDKGRVLQYGILLDHLHRHAGHEPERDDANRDTDIHGPQIIRAQRNGGHHIVHAETQIHERDHGDRARKGAMVDVDDLTLIFRDALLSGEVRTHQPDEIQRADEHDPVIIDDVGSEEQSEHPEAISADVADVHRCRPALLIKMSSHGGDGQRIVHGQQPLDEDQPENHRQGMDKLLPKSGGGGGEEGNNH